MPPDRGARRCSIGSGVRTGWPLLKAMNLVTSRPARKAALVGATRGGRALVLLPWQGRTLVGTSESSDAAAAGRSGRQAGRSRRLSCRRQRDLSRPWAQSREITLVHRGIVPAAAANGRLSLLGHSRIIDHAAGRPHAGAHLDRRREVHDGAGCRRASCRSDPAQARRVGSRVPDRRDDAAGSGAGRSSDPPIRSRTPFAKKWLKRFPTSSSGVPAWAPQANRQIRLSTMSPAGCRTCWVGRSSVNRGSSTR